MKHLLTALRILVLVLIYATIASAGEVWVITSLDWQPYSDSNSPQQGFSIHKLRTLLKRENIELRVEFYPWSRLVRLPDRMGMSAISRHGRKKSFKDSPLHRLWTGPISE